ncbi:reverse transcriptase domain-containing protein [Hydrogenophaga sp.]|uniref:reverse transcriptase domain-containing protein n=1 Tax=Hydrogenophaga sp. TaxID=1904254 RepID=UPI00263549DC|nr:reverse transcriptase domain-containing protein [Hydrogenophaga sp.]
MGLSPRLLGVLLHKPERHYRVFEIPKANGTPREICAPRTVMKLVQYFVLDYLLRAFPVHPAATAFEPGCSIKWNAVAHVGKRYVANIDVQNFFGSLTTKVVFKQLLRAGFKLNTAAFVARISSYRGSLPQGAPTSAALSNICMYEFDELLTSDSSASRVTYTRYADDITFSGDDLEAVRICIAKASDHLGALGLVLNRDKTRIFGQSSRQVVTGLVVNVKAQPTREYRRNLRSLLHHVKLNPFQHLDQYDEIQGKAAFALSFSGPDTQVGSLSSQYVDEALAVMRALRKSGQEKS